MASNDELCFASAERLLAMLRKREVSAVELTDAFLDRIEEVNPKLRAVVTLVEERAVKEAEESDNRLAKGDSVRALEGLPVTIKDSIETAGIRTTDGMKMYEHHVPKNDAPVVERLRAAGAVLVAKTNLPEMAMDYDCDNPVFGPTYNPWNLTRVPGGSSGGEAAALAAGLSPLGMGSDYGGSIRVPAHFCGVTGLKPSWGTIPVAGHMPSWLVSPPVAHMATIGPMARFVDDLTLAYNVVRCAHPTAPYTVPTQPARPEEVDIKRLSCAVFTDIKSLVPVSTDIKSRVEKAGQVLERLGLRVESSTPPIQRAHEIWWDYALADGGELARQAIGDNASLSRERLQRLVLAKTPHKSAAEFFTIAIERDKFRVELAQFMERYPIIISAPFCCTAFAQGATKVQCDGKEFDLYKANWPALWVNCAGLPSVVVPAGLDGSGLPIGVQIVGRAFEEEQVLAVARVLEKELGGYQKP